MEKKFEIASEIIKLNGRTSTVRAVCQISQSEAIAIYKEIKKCSPKGGMATYNLNWILKSRVNHLHASIFFNAFKKIEQSCASGEESKRYFFVSVYKLYLQEAKKHPKINLEKIPDMHGFFILYQCINWPEVSEKYCEGCESVYINLSNYDGEHQPCPYCKNTVSRNAA